MANDTMPARKARVKYLFPSRAEAETAFREAQRAGTILDCALNCVIHETAEWTGRKGPYAGKLFRSCSPSGGIFLLTFAPGGQKPHTDAMSFDAFSSWVDGFTWSDDDVDALRSIREKANRARHEAWENMRRASQGLAPLPLHAESEVSA